jgi:hypothetical protein
VTTSVRSVGARPSLLLVTTTDFEAGQSDQLKRLLRSVEAYRQSEDAWDVQMLLLLQRTADTEADWPGWISVDFIPSRISLSKARNRLLKNQPPGALARFTVVAFPDDDCWYPPGTLAHISREFAQDPVLDFIFCRYGSNTDAAGASRQVAPPLQTLIATASSNTIFVRGVVAEATGGFDERLGVGAPHNGGEDTDYALRARTHARKVLFIDEILVGHRDIDSSFKARYFAGGLIAIAKSANWTDGLVALLRKLLVGAWLVASRRLKPSDYARAVRIAFSTRLG